MSNVREGEFDETPTESKTTGTVGNFPHGSRETPVISVFPWKRTVGEGARPQSRHGRYRGVRQFHSTEEAGEQRRGATACGVGGGRGLTKENTEHRYWTGHRAGNRTGDRL